MIPWSHLPPDPDPPHIERADPPPYSLLDPRRNGTNPHPATPLSIHQKQASQTHLTRISNAHLHRTSPSHISNAPLQRTSQKGVRHLTRISIAHLHRTSPTHISNAHLQRTSQKGVGISKKSRPLKRKMIPRSHLPLDPDPPHIERADPPPYSLLDPRRNGTTGRHPAAPLSIHQNAHLTRISHASPTSPTHISNAHIKTAQASQTPQKAHASQTQRNRMIPPTP
jgi:hypothetical protein